MLEFRATEARHAGRRPLSAARALLALGCLAGGLAAALTDPPGVDIEPIGEGIWLHRSRSGEALANGLIVAGDERLYLIDTGWTPEQTRALLAWARHELGRRIDRAIVTHAHADRLGGLAALAEAGVPVEAIDLTVQRADRPGLVPLPGRQVYLERGLELYYPGAGHSPDNVVVWIERERLLFGGCMIRQSGLGPLADADLIAWHAAIDQLAQRYDGARRVVPGHGALGGAELLGQTRRLIEQALGSQVLEQERRRQQAMIAADAPLLEALLADELSYTHSTGAVESKRQVIEALTAGRYVYRAIAAPAVQVRVYAATAVVSGPLDMTIEAGGRRIDLRSRYTAVYVHRDGRWQLAAYQSTSAAPPAD